MASARYTIEQLLHMRQSPLVRRPDELPSIEQWLDQPSQEQQQTQRKTRNQNGRAEEPAPMGNFSSQRPSLIQTRHTSRSTAAGEDIVLGPPKTSFASSRNISKLSESGEKPTNTTTEDTNEEDTSVNARSRFFRDRDSNKSNTTTTNTAPTTTTTQKNGREDRESWHTGRAARGFGDDEDRNGDRERHNGRRDRNTDQDESGARRNGLNHRSDQRWSREGERGVAKMGETQRGGWREREREKRNDRDWDRGAAAAEKDPEWMDEPAEREDKNAMKTQEDFERWKERMRAGNTQTDVKEESAPQEAATPVKLAAEVTKPATPLVHDGPGFDKLFGTWGEAKRLDSPAEVRPAKTPAAKNKSRFASMFAPKEEPQFDEPASPSIPGLAANGSNEDKEGFARILQMLGKNTMSPAPGDDVSSSVSKDAAMGLLFGAGAQEGNRPPSYPLSPRPQDAMSAMFEKKPSSNNKLNRPQSGFAEDNSRGPPPQERPQSFGGSLSGGTPSNVLSPDPARMRSNEASHMQNRASHDMQSIFLDQPPRNMATPESLNIQQILAAQQRTPKPTSLNKDSEFLLNLIQTKNASRPPPSQATRPPHDDQDNFQLFLDQPPKLQTYAPKPQAPRPPGLLEDQLFKGGQPPPPGMDPQHNQQMPHQRVPPGFFEDPSILQQQSQRRYPAEPPQARRLSAAQHGGGIPPGMPGLGGPQQGFPAEFAFMAGPNDRGLPPPGVGPPPGFPNMRGPPGFGNMPGMFNQGPPPSSQQQHPQQVQQQQQQQPPPQGDNRMQAPPPGFPVMSNMPLPPGFGMHGGPGGLPPGFFGPGHGGMMRNPQDGGLPPGMLQQMRSPIDQMPPQQMPVSQLQQLQGQQQHVGGPPPGFVRR